MTTITELKNSLSTFICQTNLSLVIYFRMKSGETRLADINDEALPDLKELYVSNIKYSIIEKEELDIIPLLDADDRKNVIYLYDHEDDMEPFISIQNVIDNENTQLFSFENDSLEDIDGFIAIIKNSTQCITMFSKTYPVNLIKRDRTLKLIPANTRFDKFDKQLLKLNGHFEIFKFDSVYYLTNTTILERFYGFNEIIMAKAATNFEKVVNLDVIEETDFLKDSLLSLPLAKKFIKAMKSSKVIQKSITAEQIVDFVKGHSKLSEKFKFSSTEKKFIIKSKKSCRAFIELLDDDYLHSDLTDSDYLSKAKDHV